MRLGLPVLVVAAGSGNDFARSVGLGRVRDSLAAWRKFCGDSANVRSVDLGVIAAVETAGGAPAPHVPPAPHVAPAPHGTRYFCCVAGVGLDGEVARRANRLPRWLRGHGGYGLTVVPTIFTFAPLPMKILTSSEGKDESWTVRSDQPILVAAFANTPSFGGGMKIAPRAKMDDGLLDICVVGAVPPLRLLRLFPSVYSGHHLTMPEVQYFQASRVRVETEPSLDVYADGEYVCRTPVEVGVHRAALKIVTS